MKTGFFVLFVVLSVTVLVQSQLCKDLRESCDDNSSCCTGCCQRNKCVPWTRACLSDKWCKDCTPQETCELIYVNCIRAPCPPIAGCVPNCKPKCNRGSHCILEEWHCINPPCGKRAICVPNE